MILSTVAKPMLAPKRNVGIELYQWQIDAWEATRRTNSVATVTPVGEGKSWFGAHWLVAEASSIPDAWHLATANTYTQIGDTVLPKLREACQNYGLEYEYRGSYEGQSKVFLIHLRSGPVRILLRATDKRETVEKIRGVEIARWWQDESRDSEKYAFDVIQGRLRHPAAPNHRSLHTTTPNGFDWLYELFVDEQCADRELVHVTSRHNWRLPSDYDDKLLGSYDEQLADQELKAKFLNIGAGQVYRAFDRTENVAPCPINEEMPLVLCVDWNIGHSGWAIAQRGSGGTVEVVDEVFRLDSTIDDNVAAMKRDGLHLHPAGWQVYGDPSNARNRKSGETDWQILDEALRENGFNFKMRRRPMPRVKDRVNAVNQMLKNGKGERRLNIDPKCVELRRDFEQVVWKNGEIKKKDNDPRTHTSDALGYFIEAEFPAGRKPKVGRRAA